MRWLYVFASAVAMSLTWLFLLIALVKILFGMELKEDFIYFGFFVLLLLAWAVGLKLFPRGS
jgi:hypothetical protein